MKYTKGTPTALGPIVAVDEFSATMQYKIETRQNKVWLSESEIDAIVIKPKRNIDHLIELIEARKKEEAVSFITDRWQSTSWLFWLHMLDEYIAPRKYPVLTPEELKAVKWLVEGGFKTIQRCMGGWATVAKSENGSVATEALPVASFLNSVAWITETPINLKELLEAQEGV